MQKLLQRSSSYIKTLVKSDKKKLERKYKSNPDLSSTFYYHQRENNNNIKSNTTTKPQQPQQTMEYKSGILYKLSTGIFKNRKKFWFILTRTHFQYYSSPDKLSNPIENILLSDIKNIILLQKEAESLASTYGFIIEYPNINSSSNTSKLILQSDSLSSIADWVIKLDGIIHPNFKSFLNQVDRKQLLKIMYKDNIKGGIIKSSYDTEEWIYNSIGSLCIDINNNMTTSSGSSSNNNEDIEQQEKIDYHWDGEWLKSSSHNNTLGYGRFNGVYLAWFIKDSTYPEIRYFYDEKEKEYISDRKEFTFKWTRHFLASKYGSGEWIVEGHVPQIVVMFLQIIKYKRNASKPGFISPFACDIPTTSSNGGPNKCDDNKSGSSSPILIEQPTLSIINQSSSPSSSSPGAASVTTNLITPQLSTSPFNIGGSASDSTTNTTSTLSNSNNNNSNNNNNNNGGGIPSSPSSLSTDSNNSNNNNINNNNNNNNNNSKPIIKIAPFTKGNALINVSHNLFSSKDGFEDDYSVDHQKQQEISNFSTSSDDLTLSASVHSFTSHQHNISNLSDNLEVFSIIKNIKKSSEEEETNNNNNNNNLITQFEVEDDNNNKTKQQEKEQQEQEEQSNTHSKHKVSHQRKSTIQLLNETIDESEKISSRKSYIDQNTLQQIINDFNNNINYYNSKEDLIPKPKTIKDEPRLNQQQQIITPNSTPVKQQYQSQLQENNLMNSPSASSESLISSPLSKFTTPLGSVIGPNQQIQIDIKENSQTQEKQDVNSNNSNNQSTIGNHRKPLAKSKSSDKVTTIINQISATKSSRSTFCIYCNLPITGPMIVVQQCNAHSWCHKCFKCNIELGTKTFYRQQPELNTSSASYYYGGGSIGSSSGNSFLNFSNSNNFVTLSSSPSSVTGSPNKFSLSNSPFLSQSPPTNQPSSLLNNSSHNHSLSTSTNNNNNNHTHNSNLHSSASNTSLSTITNNHHKSGPRYLCQGCFDECSNICPRCNNVVQYRCRNYMGKKWHPDCLASNIINNNTNNIDTIEII